MSRHPRGVAAGVAAGAVVLLAIAVGLAISVFDDAPIADAPDAPSPSVGSSATPISTPPAPSATPLADDRLLQVSADALRMRTAASTSAAVARTLARGEVVRVLSGPVDADGFVWNEVIDLDSQRGWVVMGDATTPWLASVPTEPATGELLLRLERDCDVSLRSMSGIPVVPPDVTMTADGRVVLGLRGVVRQLSPAGSDQVQRDALDLPVLQASADYVLERLPNSPEPPGHGVCVNSVWVGEGAGQVAVTGVGWQGVEEGVYWVPSPERRALDELAAGLGDVESWLGPAAWSEPVARRYVAGSYLFWLDPQLGTPPPPGVNAPRVDGAPWPFEGPIEEFGEPIGQSRCGYLTADQAFETLRLMRELGVPTQTANESLARPLSLDGFGTGAFSVDEGLITFWLTPRSPDGYPSCTD